MTRPAAAAVPPVGVLTREECQALLGRIRTLATGGGDARLSFLSEHRGSSKWARSRMLVSSDVNWYEVGVGRYIRGAGGSASTVRIDEEGLREVVQRAENALRYNPESLEDGDDGGNPNQPTLLPTLWSETTYAFDTGKRTKLAQSMMAASDAAGLWAAGDLSIAAQGPAVLDTSGLARYYLTSEVQCSMTVRDPKGSASGWAGVNHFDIGRIDPVAIAARAFDKCKRSMNPVTLEPGRYTAILEPQAVSDLFDSAVDWLDRATAEQGLGPYSNGVDLTKIGEKIVDDRLILRADPMHPDAEFLPFDRESGEAYRPVDWIDRGVLRELSYDRAYARSNFGRDFGLSNSNSYVLMAAPGVPTATVEEMIAATTRGLLVTRFWGVQTTDTRSLMSTGFTRDGIWLVENGAIKYAVKNFRFSDSPLFALNSLEQVGVATRVFRPRRAVMVPPVRVRDFNFSALADAV